MAKGNRYVTVVTLNNFSAFQEIQMQEPIQISVVIPAYQEEQRIGYTLKQLSTYLEENYSRSELILVCDGCTDKTSQVARLAVVAQSCVLKVIELPRNLGKGNAVKQGILAATGKYLFFTDADLSFAPGIIEQFVERLKAGADIVIAQRQKSATYSNLGRRWLAVLSRAIIGNILLRGIRDTQAGFKAFQYDVAKSLFADLVTCGYLFDFELLLMARRRGYCIDKVYVDWCDRPGSKVRFMQDTIRALLDLILIFVRDLLIRASRGNDSKRP